VSNIDKLREKVAKLLRQAEDVAGTAEEAVFQAKAFELMAKYGIDQAQVEAARQGLDASDLRDAIQWIVKIEGKYASAQLMLLHNLAIALHCKTVYSTVKAYGGSSTRMYVYGVPSHIERVKMLWQILQPQMMRLVDTVRPDYNYGAGHLRSYRRSWIAGFGQAVGARLRTQETKALENESGGALVLFRGDAERASLALRNAHPRTGRAKRSSVNGAGYAHGQRDGRNASFNQSIAS